MAKVVVLVPGEGAGAAQGAGVAAAVKLALADTEPSGWIVEVEHVSDGGTRSGAAAVATRLGSDRDVVAVIGGLTDEVVRAAQPVLDRNGIPFISPADGVPEHTRGPDPSDPLRPYATYFRMAVVGEQPEAFAARYAVEGLGVDQIAIVQRDRVAEAGRVANRVRSAGARVVAAEPGDIASAVVTAKKSGAGAVYVAGDARFAAAVTTEVVRSGLSAWVIGGADLLDAEFVASAGATAGRAVAFAPATLEPTADRALPGVADPGRFGAAAYDAGHVVAETLDRCLPPVREAQAARARKGCLAELGATSLEGVTGPVMFYAYGDRPGAWPLAYVVVDGEWREIGGTMTR